MKAKISFELRCPSTSCHTAFPEPYGVELIAESSDDRKVLERFSKGGVKLNRVSNTDQKIQFTFADLIES